MGQAREFKWKQFEAEIILLCMRWVHEYAPKIHKKIGPSLRKTNRFWKVDETMIKLKGKWVFIEQ